DHRAAVQPVIAVAHDTGVTNRDESEEALGATQHPPELVDRVVGVTALEGPDHPRIKRVVAGAIRDVSNAGKELSVERNARRLDTEVIEATDRFRRLHPCDGVSFGHLTVPSAYSCSPSPVLTIEMATPASEAGAQNLSERRRHELRRPS